MTKRLACSPAYSAGEAELEKVLPSKELAARQAHQDCRHGDRRRAKSAQRGRTLPARHDDLMTGESLDKARNFDRKAITCLAVGSSMLPRAVAASI